MLWVLRKPVGVTTRSLAFFLQGKHIIYKLLPSASMSKYHSVLLLMEKILHQSIPRRSHFSIGFYTSQVVHRSWSPWSLCKANGPAEDRSNACMEYCKLLKLQDEPVLARGLDAKNKPSLEAKWMSMKIEEQSAHMICKFMLMHDLLYLFSDIKSRVSHGKARTRSWKSSPSSQTFPAKKWASLKHKLYHFHTARFGILSGSASQIPLGWSLLWSSDGQPGAIKRYSLRDFCKPPGFKIGCF